MSNAYYDVVESPHGLTCRSKVAIPKGTAVLADEPPFLNVPSGFTQNLLSKEVLRVALLDAKEEDRRAYLALCNAWRGTERDGYKLDPLTGTFITNAIATSDTHSGIFFKASRFQHSCTPNCIWHFNPTSKTLIIKSVVPIPINTELTLSYISTLLPLTDRQARLHYSYNFACRCPKACALAYPEGKGPRKTKGSQKSELRRYQVRSFKEMMRAYGGRDGPTAKDIWDVAPALLGEQGALELEGLKAEASQVWLDLAMICASASAIAASRFCATQAQQIYTTMFSPTHERTTESKSIAKDPRRCKSWNTRKVESLGEWEVALKKDPKLVDVLLPVSTLEEGKSGEGKENVGVGENGETGEKKKKNKKKKKKAVKKEDGTVVEVEVEVDVDAEEKESAVESA